MPEGVNMYQKLAEKVTDGTSCGYDFRGVCIDGQCKVRRTHIFPSQTTVQNDAKRFSKLQVDGL
jgi:hypothetical protein